jgi:hypothetical protein
MRRGRLLGLLVAVSCLPFVACGSADKATSGQVAKALPWAGTWTTTYGRMVLHQEGSKVIGTYTFCDGKIEGRARAAGLTGTWRQRLGCDGTDMPSGPFHFRLAPARRSFTGTWSYAGDPRQGPWTGTRRAASGV